MSSDFDFEAYALELARDNQGQYRHAYEVLQIKAGTMLAAAAFLFPVALSDPHALKIALVVLPLVVSVLCCLAVLLGRGFREGVDVLTALDEPGDAASRTRAALIRALAEAHRANLRTIGGLARLNNTAVYALGLALVALVLLVVFAAP